MFSLAAVITTVIEAVVFGMTLTALGAIMTKKQYESIPEDAQVHSGAAALIKKTYRLDM